MSRSPYVIDYQASFRFPVGARRLWGELERVDRFERWWGWLGDVTVVGDGLRTGSVLRGTVNPPVPCRMSVEVALDACEPGRRIDASVHGDLEGPAWMLLQPEGHDTRVVVGWHVEMRSKPMRTAARVASPMLRWGHDRVVEATVAGFRRHLRDHA